MFSGHSERYDGLDCVAVFDGRVWRLEMLAGSVKVRYAFRSEGAIPSCSNLYNITGSLCNT